MFKKTTFGNGKWFFIIYFGVLMVKVQQPLSI